jgi:chemotaxis protein methyltransferase WspC
MDLVIHQRALFEDLLQAQIGLDAASIGPAAMERAIRRRMNACSISEEFPYLNLVRTSQDELDELVEEVIVPETWFFRNIYTFETLVKHALSQQNFLSESAVFRALSVPCATGEEPYSIAIALYDAGIPLDHFHIDAVDISRRTLQLAERATYGKNSFRGKNLEFRSAFFEVVEHGFRLVPYIRNKVHLIRDNVLKSVRLVQQQPYDVIFCRNLFIYLEPLARQRILHLLTGLLKNNGLLFLGPAETRGVPGPEFISISSPKAFAFRKQSRRGSLS